MLDNPIHEHGGAFVPLVLLNRLPPTGDLKNECPEGENIG
jgi:hypothetical protein